MLELRPIRWSRGVEARPMIAQQSRGYPIAFSADQLPLPDQAAPAMTVAVEKGAILAVRRVPVSGYAMANRRRDETEAFFRLAGFPPFSPFRRGRICL